MGTIAILGGTGAQGLGLALRFAVAGEAVVVGSRSAERAAASALDIAARVPGAIVRGLDNPGAVAIAERVLLAFPPAGVVEAIDGLSGLLDGKLVIDVMVPLAFRKGRAEIAPVEGAPSLGELVQRKLPGARVVSAFKNVSADLLQDLSRPLSGDVLVCGDDVAARGEVAALAARIPDLRPVDAGALSAAHAQEAITALLVNLNRQHHARTSIAIVGLPADAGVPAGAPGLTRSRGV